MIRRIWQLLLFLTVSSVLLTSCAQLEARGGNLAVHGTLSLDSHSNDLVAVRGQWEYYPHVLLYPLDFDQHVAETAAAGNPVTFRNGSPRADFATYRISILNPGSSGYHGLLIPKIGSAETLWVDGKKVGQSGTVGATMDTEMPGPNGIAALFDQSSDRLDLVLQVSDLHRTGGNEVGSPILYGTARAITDYESTSRGIEIALVTLLCVLGLLFLFRSLAPRKDGSRVASIAVFATSLAAIVRTLFVPGAGGLAAAAPLLHGLPWVLAGRLSIFSYFLLFAAYSLTFLPRMTDRAGRTAVQATAVLGALAAVAAVFIPAPLHAVFAVWGGGALTVGILALLVLSFVVHAGRGAGGILTLYSIGTVVLFLGAVNDLLVYAGAPSAGYIAPVAAAIFAILVLFDDRVASPTAVSASRGAMDPAEVEIFTEDIRKPVRSIVGLAESLLSGRGGDLDDDQVISLSLIAASGLRLSNAVSDLVDRDKIQRNALELEISKVAVESLVEHVSDYLKPLLLVSSVEVKNELPRDLPRVRGDRRRIEQIIYNVLAEALRHRARGVVVVSGRVVGDHVQFSVRTEVQSTTADEDTKSGGTDEPDNPPGEMRRSEEYSKLGMEVATELVRLHGGTLSDKRKGKDPGFEITFSLPKASDGGIAEEAISEELIQLDGFEDSSLPGDQSPAQSVRGGFRILLADNDLVTLQTMSNHLVNERYRVRAVTNGEEVLSQVESSPPDLLIIDASLPKVDGVEVCRRVRKRYASTELPILILVEKEQVTSLVEGMTAGASDFISKPVVPDELLARIKTHINLSKMNTLYSRFVPVELLHFLGHENVIELQLGDQIQREMTILFVDIRAFTNLSEGMTPQENFKFINSYLARITPIIRENNGFIDKYIGDAILALYPGSPEDALRSAIRMVDYLQEYNGYRRNSGYRPINIGIGIHTGNLIVGIIGDSARMQGTVISDAVNLASRVQDVTKLYGANIIISQDTFIQLENPTAYNFRFLGKVKVKGKNQTVSLFEVFDGEPPERIALKSRTKQSFEDAILMFSQRKFAEASESFRRISTQNPDDRAAALFLNRAELFLKREKANWLLK